MIKYRKLKAGDITQRRIVVFGYNLVILSVSNDRGWIRLFGIGVTWVSNQECMAFSERIGKRKTIVLFGKRFGKLGHL